MMELEYSVVFPKLSSKRELLGSRAVPVIIEQLCQQHRYSSNSYRYEVTIEIVEGQKRPVKDVDNYAKRTIDAITRTKLLWHDDEQIDTLTIRRSRDRSHPESRIVIRIRRTEGQHSGVPTFFRACCREASLGCQFTYAHPAYHLSIHLWSQQPYDLDEVEWAEKIGNLCSFLDGNDAEGTWNWFCEHFPKCMKLVPQRRMEQFVSGVFQAYEDERISG
jgi:Holliday junction resolvase RusA-like endonuclease